MSRPDSWLPDIDDTSCLRAEPTARCPAEGSPRCAHCAWTRVVVVPLPVRIPECDGLGCSCCSVVSALQSGYAESELHHNRHYGVPSEVCHRTSEPGHLHVWQAGKCVARDECRVMFTRRCPVGGCAGRPCARFKDDDESRWPVRDTGQPPACPDCARAGRVNSLGCQGCYQERKAYYRRVADNPCADSCSDPAAHAEGGHDV